MPYLWMAASKPARRVADAAVKGVRQVQGTQVCSNHLAYSATIKSLLHRLEGAHQLPETSNSAIRGDNVASMIVN
jgi:hypothetical protein